MAIAEDNLAIVKNCLSPSVIAGMGYNEFQGSGEPSAGTEAA